LLQLLKRCPGNRPQAAVIRRFQLPGWPVNFSVLCLTRTAASDCAPSVRKSWHIMNWSEPIAYLNI
jgi:hypothetical protein